MQLTRVQRDYLLAIGFIDERLNLTKLAKIFECSKVNSKNHLDKLVELGLVENNNRIFELTDTGKIVYDKHIDAFNYMNTYLTEVLRPRFELNIVTKMKFLEEESIPIMVEQGEILYKVRQCRQPMSNEDIIEIFGSDDYILHLSKIDNMGLTQPLNNPGIMKIRGQDGFALFEFENEKTKYVNEVKLVQNGEFHKLDIVDKGVKMPLNLLTNWSYIGGAMIQAAKKVEISYSVPGEEINTETMIVSFTINLLEKKASKKG